jgi:hypothetical protein
LPSPSTTPDPRGTPDTRGTPSLSGHDRSPSPHPVEQQIFQELSAVKTTPHTTPRGWNFDEDSDTIRVATLTRKPYIPNRQQNNAPQRRDPDLSQENIVTGKRRRQAYFIEATPALSKHFAFATMMQQSREATSLTSQRKIKPDLTRLYQNNLPPPPRHWKELKRHAHRK